MSDDGFYHAFEAAFRGSREEIRIRLKAYRPYLKPLLAASDMPRQALDLGCGRGEWIELVGEMGFEARGVDLDAAMLDDARALGLRVDQAGALETLRACEADTLALVSAFHLIEHLDFGDLIALAAEAHRALAPGGLMILETPNAENVDVATVTFHNDPTHRAPVPPNVLVFLGEHSGFAQVCLRRLNERPLVAGRAISLSDVFTQASPDYAVIAQKDGPEDLRAPLRPLLSERRGLQRDGLAQRFEDRLAERSDVADLALALNRELHHVRHAHAVLVQEHQALRAEIEAGRDAQASRSATEKIQTWRDAFASRARGLLPRPAKTPPALPPPARRPAPPPDGAPESGAVRTLRQRARPAAGPLPDRLTWQMEGPFDSSYSLAVVNRALARALAGNDVSVRLVSAEGPGPFDPNPLFLESNPDLQTMRDTEGPADVVSRNMYPPRVSDFGAGFTGLHSYAWEETGLPEDYVAAFNTHLSFLTVPSDHVKKIMRDNGVAVPIVVVGNGVDHLDAVEVEALPEGAVPEAGTLFVHVSSCFPRKGADCLLAAWAQAFTRDDDVALVIKTFDNPHNDIRRRLRLLEAEYPDLAPVTILSGEWSAGQLRGLYQTADLAVFPSRAEGFGLPIAEAVLDGCPVVTTGWSGQRAFDGCPMVRFVDYRLTAADSHLGAHESFWAEPDLSELTTELRQAAGRAPPAAEERAAARDWLLARYAWDDVAKRSGAAVRQAAAAELRWPRVGWVSTFNSRCGIATYSAHLIDRIGAPVHVLAPRDATTIVDDAMLGIPVDRCWTDDARDPLQRLFSTIERLDLETIVLQFNYAFYEFESLGRLIHRLRDSDRQVILMMHGTDDSRAPRDRQLGDIREALARCTRLLVHKRVDLDRLKALGLSDNVTLFPHGCLPTVSEDGRPSWTRSLDATRPIEIGTCGFLLGNKGLPELIEAVALLRAKKIDVRLSMLNAEYPKEESRLLRAHCAKLILARKLAPFVRLDTRFRPDQEILSELSDCDLVVFPYQHSAESASGAVRYGLTAGRPVAVTPLSIFSDVSEVSQTLPGTSPEDLAQGLHALIRRLRAGDDFAAMRARARAECSALSYERLGPRLHNVIMGLNLDRD